MIKNLLGYYFSGNARFFGFARIFCFYLIEREEQMVGREEE